jgi:hypothetical protein
MKKMTRWGGKTLAEGTVIDVDGGTARRWLANGIAEQVEEISPATTVKGGEEGGAADGTDDTGKTAGDVKTDADLAALKQKDLIGLAKGKGITFKAGTTKKQLVDMINNHSARAGGAD